jgi:hypothetical protein
MASTSEMMDMLRQFPLVDVVMKCGQVICGQVADLEGEFMVVNEPDRRASCWVRQEEIAFIRLHPPLENVRYPEDEQQGLPPRQAYGSPYMPTVFDNPDPTMYDHQQPMPRQSGRVVVAPDMRAKLEQVKQRHRTAEFVTRRHAADTGMPEGPRMERRSQQQQQEMPAQHLHSHSPGQVYRPRIDNSDTEEPQE